MKRILLCLLIIISIAAKAQVYNNEWIDHSKTYYKFKIDSSAGLRRIPQSALASIGWGATPAEHFQLWRNGVEVPIYTSVTSGPLSATDYIEFLGEMNDGKPDKELYRRPEFQLSEKWSLQTDSATYFLTVNPTGGNKRLQPTLNNVSGNTLSPEPYFMHTAGKYFRDRLFGGYAVNVNGTYVYSSAYDKAEGWASNDIVSSAINGGGVNNGTLTVTFNNLFVSNTGPAPKFKAAVSGNAVITRSYKVTINGDSVLGNNVDYFNYAVDSSSFNLSTIASGSASITLTNKSNVICFQRQNGSIECQVDRMVVHQFELTYPRLFNFGGATNFEFRLPASSSGNYLEISGFSYGSEPPVLLDVTNGKRYVADLSAAPLVRVVLEPSATERKLILVSLDPGKIKTVNTFKKRVFTNFSLEQNQGNYLIITNPILFNGANGTNPVEDYRAYRSSMAGGGHSAKVYLVDELFDQFAFGIKAHPAGIRNFINFANKNFSIAPKNVLLIGKGVNYVEQRTYETNPTMEMLDLVPTFGNPASDNLLAASPGSALLEIPIGRVSAVNAAEVAVYLEKIKQMEETQAYSSSKISDKAWMKNVVHVVGADGDLVNTLGSYFETYKKIISDSLYGGTVSFFSKKTNSTVEALSSKHLEHLFAEGISLFTYFGHSGSAVLAYNIEVPSKYNNTAKYPLFVALGCNAGSMFSFTNARNGLSELYVLAPQKGTIGFLASSHYGIVYYMDVWNEIFYKKIARDNYGSSVGETMKATALDVFKAFNQEDFYLRSTVEQMQLHGDPAFKLNPHTKPDYAIEDPMVKTSPSFISVASGTFNVKAKFINLGKAPSKNVVVEIKQKFPNNIESVVFRDTIPGIKYADSINVDIPIDPIKDRGLNSITVTIDADNEIDEYYETNNSVTKEFVIYDDEAKPLYPYNFSIINQQGISFYGSTANPLSKQKDYKIEVDTTENFNSTLKVSQTIKTSGGVLKFDPSINFLDKTVYYWRIATVPDSGDYKWNTFSFEYISGSETGFGQSHFYQHTKSALDTMKLDSVSRQWEFGKKLNNIYVRNGVFGTAAFAEGDLTVSLNDDAFIRSACVGFSLIFNVFDPLKFKPALNTTGRYGSALPCQPSRNWNFEYTYMNAASRKKIMDFMDSIPNGSYVVVRNLLNNGQTTGFINDWKSDTTLYGSNNSLYHKLKSIGFNGIDSFYSARAFALIYKKGDDGFQPVYTVSQGMYDKITLNFDAYTLDNHGTIRSPLFGKANAWKELQWEGASTEASPTDISRLNIIGIKENGSSETIIQDILPSQTTVDISSIDAKAYPYLQLELRNIDSVNLSPYQLKSWKILYTPIPEGVLSPNLGFSLPDTVDQVGDVINMNVMFKNVTPIPFDSLKVKLVIVDKNNISREILMPRFRPLPGNDTLSISSQIDTKDFSGLNSLYIEANPDKDQPEQYRFNNYLYKDFYVKADSLNPLLDVTFDNVHILNRDIVSSKPDILIKLKDENLKYLLNDTSKIKLLIKYPSQKQVPVYFNNPSVRFQPAQAGNENIASVNLKPHFTEDGEYELIVSAQDGVGNKAGVNDYRIAFQVINKAMISNMLNYPNPFTTSTAFVFTLTGSEVPQNIKIQVLTVTGKIVREITKDELGPLRIGRNITEFKWDGTDMYGQKLANGVYLYRVVTNLNGKSLDKFKSATDDTDKYFNKGYGKMYLMR